MKPASSGPVAFGLTGAPHRIGAFDAGPRLEGGWRGDCTVLFQAGCLPTVMEP